MAVDLLEGLDDDDRRALTAKMVRRSYRKGDTLFFEGDLGDSIHIIQRGHVAIRTSTREGDEVTLNVLGPGDSFGELALLGDDSRRTASVVALDPVETRALHRHDFVELRQRHPRVEQLLIDVLAAQVRRLTAFVREALFDTAEQRVVRRTAQLADVFLDVATTDGRIEMPVRQEDIASLAGTTRPTTNRVLKQLEAEGVLELARGRTVVTDHDGLRRLVR